MAFQDGLDGVGVSIFWLEEVTGAMLRGDVGNVTNRMEELESSDDFFDVLWRWAREIFSFDSF